MEKLNINQWVREDRPREKMMQKGGSLERCRTASHPHRLRQYGKNRRDTDAAILAACGKRPQPPGQMGGGISPDSKAWAPPKASPSWHPWNWANAASCRNAPDVPPSALPPTSTSCSIPCSATLPQKNSGYWYGEPRRQSDRQGTHQPRRHRPDHRRRAQYPARSPCCNAPHR